MKHHWQKKHRLAFLLVGVMLLAACGQSPAPAPAPATPPAQENTAGAPDPAGVTTIAIAARAGAMADALKAVAAEYTQETGI